MVRISIVDRIHQSGFAFFHCWDVRFSRLTGRKSNTAAVAVWYRNRLLVVEQSYQCGLTLPGGHIRSNELPVSAATRELKEETGVVIAAAEPFLFGRFEQRHTCLSLFECWLAREPEIRIDNREITAASFMTPDAISEPSWTLRSYLRTRRLWS